MIELNLQDIEFVSGGDGLPEYPPINPNLGNPSGGVDLSGISSLSPGERNPLKRPGPYNAYYAM